VFGSPFQFKFLPQCGRPVQFAHFAAARAGRLNGRPSSGRLANTRAPPSPGRPLEQPGGAHQSKSPRARLNRPVARLAWRRLVAVKSQAGRKRPSWPPNWPARSCNTGVGPPIVDVNAAICLSLSLSPLLRSRRQFVVGGPRLSGCCERPAALRWRPPLEQPQVALTNDSAPAASGRKRQPTNWNKLAPLSGPVRTYPLCARRPGDSVRLNDVYMASGAKTNH